MRFTRTSGEPPAPKLLAIASGGGHWEQLMLMRDAFDAYDVHFVTTICGLAERASIGRASVVKDCNRNNPLQVARCAIQLLAILMRFRPDVVLSTGALPGAIALILAKTFRAKTIWIDSVANAEAFSMSGKLARKFSDRWVSQWKHVAERSGATYLGSVL
jgi:UDP-N-acetylglucosamine:LPS N-acetylglucosamine transferase